ncbi:MAG: hypothetical protein ACOYVG_12415 [Bacteroidota bacterium]
MANASLNDLVYEKLEDQLNLIYEQLTRPLFQQYTEMLKMYQAGTLIFMDADGIEDTLIEKANEIGAINEYAAFIEANTINEKAAIAYLKEELRSCFTEEAAVQQFAKSGAVSFSYDWYFHFDSGINFFKEQFTYPIILEPRYLNHELPPDHYDGFGKGPDFSEVWPDCGDLIEKEDEENNLLNLGNHLMMYYQYQSRLFLHKAIREMDEAGELSFIIKLPFIFYIAEHDSEEMTLYVK